MKNFQPFLLFLLIIVSQHAAHAQAGAPQGTYLENLTWPEAAKLLTAETVVVIPLGAQAKAHGAHMTLNADFVQSQYFAREISKTEKVVIAPQLNYGFYFPFVKFEGSTTLRHSVAKNLVLDICRSLASFGPKRFYIINEGIVTNAALRPAAELLAGEGILLSYTDLTSDRVDSLLNTIEQQKEGGHADEIETSKLLYMQPQLVNMSLAKKDFGVRKGSGFPTHDSTESGHYIRYGIWGDATLASREKGEKITKGMLKIMKEDIDLLRRKELPERAKREYKNYIGVYKLENDKTVSIIEKDGLIVQLNNLPEEKVNYEGNNYFAGFYYEVWFETNDAGEVSGLRLTDVTGRSSFAKKQY